VTLLRQRSFALLWAGSALNAIGSWATLIAMWGFATYRFHAGAGTVALIGLAWGAPAALLTPIAGVPVDRLGPRRVLMAAYLLGSLTSLAMAGVNSLSSLIILGLLQGLGEAFTRPAAGALPPRLVEDSDLMAANALLGSAQQSAIVFGPMVAAAAIALAGLRAAFVVDAMTFVVGAGVLLPIQQRPISDADAPRPPTLRAELAEGFVQVRTSPTARYVLTLSLAVFLTWGTFMVIEPLYARQVLHQPATVFALFQVVFGVGLMGTGLLLPRFGDRFATPRAVAVSVAFSGVAAATYIGTHWVFVAFVGVFFWGIDVGFYFAPAQTLLQRGTPMSAHGRVMGLFNALNSWANVVALPVAAWLAGAAGPRFAGLCVSAVAVTAGAVGLLRHPTAAPKRRDEILIPPEPAGSVLL
jgi:MFS family permease